MIGFNVLIVVMILVGVCIVSHGKSEASSFFGGHFGAVHETSKNSKIFHKEQKIINKNILNYWLWKYKCDVKAKVNHTEE